jgi:hypothetical protein
MVSESQNWNAHLVRGADRFNKEFENDNRPLRYKFMDLDHRWIGDRVHHSAILLPHHCTSPSLYIEVFLAWKCRFDRAVGNLLYSPRIERTLK